MIRWAAFTQASYSALPASAVGLELRYEALERLIAQQVFIGDGRRYVHGSAASRRQYAYLETPHIGAQNGRLQIAARFSGPSAVGLLGLCAAEGVNVTTETDSYYIRGVRRALAQGFQKDFKIDVREQARKLVEQGPENATVRAERKDFELSGVSLTPDSAVLEVECRLVVK